MSLVKFVTLQTFFFQQINLQLQTAVDLSQLGGLNCVSLLQLNGVGLEPL